MKCMICGQSLHEVGLLERVNDKGRAGLWACRPHFDDARAYFPDDDPSASGPMPDDDWDSNPLGPWTGGVTPANNPASPQKGLPELADATHKDQRS